MVESGGGFNPNLLAGLTPVSERMKPLHAWLLAEGRLAPSLVDFLGAFGREAVGAGFPVKRLFLGVRTLHPQIAAIGHLWNRGDAAAAAVARYFGIMDSPAFTDSPLKRIYLDGESEIRRRLTGPEAVIDFPILAEMREEGATDYAVFGLKLQDGVRAALSLASDAPAGFAEDDLAAFRALLPLFAMIVEAKENARLARSLLQIYLGPDSGDAVLGGRIRRGDASTIAAAIWFCDLRHFTRLSNELPRDIVIATLNDYFDAMAAPLTRRGGEILKFIGDAMLAIFPMRDDMDRDVKCRAALDAALEALAGLRDLNALRASGGQEPLKVGIGLHAGTLSYGNIGALAEDRVRLDFTVIGPAVNLAARLQALCAQLDEPLLASRRFASVCGLALKPLGAHPLRGFAEPEPVFGLP